MTRSPFHTLLFCIFGVLACFRLARCVAWETGAFGIFAKIRSWFPNVPWFQEGISCVHCLSFWFALPFAFLVFFPSFWGDFTLYWLGFAGAVSLYFDLTAKP